MSELDTLFEHYKEILSGRYSLPSTVWQRFAEKCLAHETPTEFLKMLKKVLKQSTLDPNEIKNFDTLVVNIGLTKEETVDCVIEMVFSGEITGNLSIRDMKVVLNRKNMTFSDVMAHPTMHDNLKHQALACLAR